EEEEEAVGGGEGLRAPVLCGAPARLSRLPSRKRRGAEQGLSAGGGGPGHGPDRFPHVRDVLAEALRLLPALGAARRYPLDSVIPDKRHEHCNPSGSHYTRYILFRYGCRI
ncbi:hypothetical protein JRQ81_003327, partial [Phrynocephalus forsythii]